MYRSNTYKCKIIAHLKQLFVFMLLHSKITSLTRPHISANLNGFLSSAGQDIYLLFLLFLSILFSESQWGPKLSLYYLNNLLRHFKRLLHLINKYNKKQAKSADIYKDTIIIMHLLFVYFLGSLIEIWFLHHKNKVWFNK